MFLSRDLGFQGFELPGLHMGVADFATICKQFIVGKVKLPCHYPNS